MKHFQKRHTTTELPFRKVRNHGEVRMIFVENSHAPIVSKEAFEKVQALMASRREHTKNSTPPQKYPLTGKLICPLCGKTYRRKIGNGGRIYWICNSHYKRKDLCPSMPIDETVLQAAFIQMWNKLKANAKHILAPMLKELSALQELFERNNVKVCDINRQIAELTEQNHAYSKLQAKGYMDSAIFIAKSAEIGKRVSDLRTQRRQMISDSEYDCIEQIAELTELLDAEGYLAEMADDLFESAIARASIVGKSEITFVLKCGLEFTEYS